MPLDEQEKAGMASSSLSVQYDSGIQGLKPPEPLRELTGVAFQKWKKRFEIYMLASGANKKSEDVQIALLLHCLGEECIEIYGTFGKVEQRYDIVMQQFEQHFVPEKNESIQSYRFFTRKQMQNESFDAYLIELRKLAADCNFGDLTNKMIRDRIVAGMSDRRLKDRLLRETKLDLDRTIQICKAAELAAERVKELDDSSIVVDKINKKKTEVSTRQRDNQSQRRPEHQQKEYQRKTTGYQQRGQAQHQQQQLMECQRCGFKQRGQAQHQQQQLMECQRCGFKHDRRMCPAYGKKCIVCNKSGHFARKCRFKMVRNVNLNRNQESDSETEVCLTVVCIDSVSSDKDWFEKIEFVEQNKRIKFKLDTGAQCNVLPESYCNKIGIYSFEKTNLKLTSYNGDKIVTVGQVTLKCKIGNMIRFVNFQVCQGDLVPILGLSTLSKFNLIKRVSCADQNENIDNIKVNCSDLLIKYKDVFEGLGQIKDFEYKIKLKENWQGKIEPSRHVPFKLMPKLKAELEKLEKLGIVSKIEKATDFVSSLVMTTKSDGSLRVCLDPQYLNSQIKREQLLIPTLDEITSKLSGSRVYSTLDANKGFWMIKLSNDSKELTTFNTPYGRYHFNRLPFGLSSSPEVFHRVFTNIFKDIEGVEIYIDDVLIHATSKKEHDIILEKVLKRAQEAGIKFNKNKCKLRQTEVKYLGHILTVEGVKVDKDRINAIIDMEEPKNQKELLRFLGMINYVSRFIPHVSEITAPLRELTKKDVPFIWAERQKNAYKLLKKHLSEPPVLAFFQIDKKITLSVDASKEGLGAVILQEGQPVAYGSRAMTNTEKLYSQIEKESLAILYGCTKFHQYLYGQSFTVESDHKPLISIFSKPLNKCPARLQRIRLALQPYTFNLVYKPGKELLVADHLSRSHLNNTSKSYDIDIEAHVGMILNSFIITDQKMKELIEETARDKELVTVCKYVREGWPENKWEIASEAKIYYSYRDELGESGGLLLKGNQIVIPIKKRKEVLEKIHYAHLGIEKCKKLARKTLFWPNMTKEIEDMIQNCNTCKEFQNSNRKEPMICKEVPNDPWQILAADIFFLYRVPYLLVVDSYSKFIEIQELNNLSAKCTIENLKQIFARHGVPNVLYSDPGSQFTSGEFKEFVTSWNFNHKIVSPKHHQANGLAERHIQTIKRILKKIIYDKKDIYLGLLIYRNTPVTDDGRSPAELLFNRNVRNVIPSVRKEWKYERNDSHMKELLKRQEIQKKYYNKGTRYLPDLTEGDVVKIVDEDHRKPHNSGIVIRKAVGPRSYIIKNENGDRITRNRKLLIKGGQFKENLYDSLEENYDTEREKVKVKQERQEKEDGMGSGNIESSSMMDRQSSSDNYDSGYTTRSGRTIKRPLHLRDFV